jgi:hypothetical protein
MFGGGCATKALWSKLGEDQRKIVYYPYSGADMLDYIYTIPWKVKLGRSKGVLRQLATNLSIPRFIMDRRKSAFGVDPKHWAATGGWFEPLIPLTAGLFPQGEIQRLQSTNAEEAQTFWNIVNYAVWRRVIIKNEPQESLLDELRESIWETSISRANGVVG